MSAFQLILRGVNAAAAGMSRSDAVAQLARCRAEARHLKMAARHRAAGNAGKASFHENQARLSRAMGFGRATQAGRTRAEAKEARQRRRALPQFVTNPAERASRAAEFRARRSSGMRGLSGAIAAGAPTTRGLQIRSEGTPEQQTRRTQLQKQGSQRLTSTPQRRSGQPFNPPVGLTTAKVTWKPGAKEELRRWFPGATEQELASLSGAPGRLFPGPAGAARVTVRKSELNGKDIEMTVEHPAYDGPSIRTLTRHPDGSVTIHNDILMLKPEYRKFYRPGETEEARFAYHGADVTQPFKRPKGFEQAQHLGREVFMRQVETAHQLGVRSIDTQAHRSKYQTITDLSGHAHEKWNGYYTWPRFGYDAEIGPNHKALLQQSNLPPNLKNATRFSDLFEHEAGRKWWRENGISTHMEFDLSPGSHSMTEAAQYMRDHPR